MEQRQVVPGQVIDPETNHPSWLVMLDADPRVTEPDQGRALVHEVLEQTIGSNRALFIYEYAVIGFAASMSGEEAQQLTNHPLVRHVEPIEMSSDELTAEFSPNGGRNWYPLDSTGERVQSSLCINP